MKPAEPEKKVEKPLEKDEVINILITTLCIIYYIGLVLGGINILLMVYGITNSKRYLIFHGILVKHN